MTDAKTLRTCAAMLRGWSDEITFMLKEGEQFEPGEMDSLARDLVRTADTLHDLALAAEKPHVHEYPASANATCVHCGKPFTDAVHP